MEGIPARIIRAAVRRRQGKAGQREFLVDSVESCLTIASSSLLRTSAGFFRRGRVSQMFVVSARCAMRTETEGF